MHMAVKTAMSLPVAIPVETMPGINPIAAPADPNAVIGTAMHSAEVNPNNG
jgi:hypothetical protein